MSRQRYQDGCLFREKRKGPDVWVFRFRDGQINRKEIIGTVEQFPTKSKALKASELLRANINREVRSPRTVAELVAHYKDKELSAEGNKAHSTREVYGSYLKTWVVPAWGTRSLSDVRTVEVQETNLLKSAFAVVGVGLGATLVGLLVLIAVLSKR